MKLKNKIVKYSSIIIGVFFLTVVFSAMTYAATHYVSSTGSASWADCTNINTPCSLSTAASNADDDDIVFLRGGNYGSQKLNPSNSGISGHVITFARYKSEKPSFTRSGGPSIYINGKSYIVIDGLTFTGGTLGMMDLTNGSNYNEIKNCTFSNPLDGYSTIDVGSSHYNYFHDNTFTNTSYAASDEAGEGDSFWFSDADYNRVIGNHFYDGMGHSFIWLSGYWANYDGSDYNVVRGNDFTVTGQWDDNDKEALDVYVGAENQSNHNLIEDNTISLSSNTTAKAVPMQLNRITGTIYRRNIHSSPNGNITIYNYGFPNSNNEYNLCYNNTFYNINKTPWTAYVGAWTIEATDGYYTRYNQMVNNIFHSIGNKGFLSGDTGNYSYIINNKFRGNVLYNVDGYHVSRFGSNMTISNAQSSYPSEISDNLTSDPKFNNVANGDFTLQSDSPAIDAGAWLTIITSTTGSGTTFKVDNPHFFYDGWRIPGETGDVIKTKNGQTATIIEINYSTGQITVDRSIDWTNGEGVALYYQGNKPDIGAEEYLSDGSAISSPKGLFIRVDQ